MDLQQAAANMDPESSEDEDVFECGRCREKFVNLEGFMQHKNNRVCRKAKQKGPQPGKDVTSVAGTAIQVVGSTVGEIPQTNQQITLEEPLDAKSDYNDIIRAASIACGIDNLVASAAGNQKQDNQPIVVDGLGILTQQSQQLDNLVLPTLQQSQPKDDKSKIISQQQLGNLVLPTAQSNNGKISQQQPVNFVLPSAQPNNISEPQLGGNFVMPIAQAQPNYVVKISQQDQVMSQENMSQLRAQETQHIAPKDDGGSDDDDEDIADDDDKDEDESDMVEISLASFNINCSFCSSAFTNYSDLRQHFVSEHRISKEQIDKLIKDLEKSIKKKHVVEKKGKNASPGRPRGRKKLPTNCDLCNKVFSTRKNFLKHNRSKHHLAKVQAKYVADAPGKRMKKCSHCTFTANSGKELTDHIKNRHSQPAETEEEVVEPKRGRGRPRKTAPTIRYRAVLGSCPECGKQLKGKLLAMHIKRCQSKNTIDKCSECGKSVMKKALYRHQRRCINKKHLICPLCKHQSRERYDYSVHVNGHKSWLPAEPGDVPPQKDEVIEGAAEQVKKESENQDPVVQPNDDNKDQIVNDPTHDTISTLDLSVLGLTPTPTPVAAPVVDDVKVTHNREQVVNDHWHQLPGHQAAMDNTGTSDLLNLESSSPKEAADNLIPVDDNQTTRQKQLKCHSCENWYQRTEFKHHMYTVHNLVKKFKCKVDNCSQALNVVDQFLEHCRSHDKEPPYSCGCRSCLIRNANTDDPEYIKELKKQKLKEYYQGMSYKCHKCWIKFPSLEGLERHNRKETHSHPCPHCGKIQPSKRQLRMHMVTHNSERNYLCEECGSSFKTQRDLTKHHMSHSDFKPFVCQECGKGFLFKNKLDRHRMTVHSNEKPYKCTAANCEKAFSRSDKLRDHERTHLLYEPFHCRFCPKGFFRKDNLKDHEVLHTKDYRFKCDKCPKGFMRPKLLARHIAHEHGEQNTAYNENNTNNALNATQQQLMPLKLTKSKPQKKPKPKRQPAPVIPPQPQQVQDPTGQAQCQNLTSQITYMIYQQAGSSMAAALQQAMQSVNAGADGLPVSLPPEVLQAYHIPQHGGKMPHVQDYPPIVGAEEQIAPDPLQDRNDYDRNDFRLA